MTGRPPCPSTIAPTPDGYEWRSQLVPGWRTPVLYADRCWYGICSEEPVAELRRDFWSPMAGQVVTHWRGRCAQHLHPFWIQDGELYRWALEPADSGSAFEALTTTVDPLLPSMPSAGLVTTAGPYPSSAPLQPAIPMEAGDRRRRARPWLVGGAAAILLVLMIGAATGKAPTSHPAAKAAASGPTIPTAIPTTHVPAGSATTAPTPTGCGSLPAGGGVYLNCRIPSASSPYATFTDSEQIDLAMGSNSFFRGSGAGSTIWAVECVFDGADPTSPDACDVDTMPADFPYQVYADGSFDYVADNSGETITISALPDASNPTPPITCGVGHPCVWWIGTDYSFGFTTGPHVFSNPFIVTGAKDTPSSSTVIVPGPPNGASITTLPAGGVDEPPAHRLGQP
jgi:hypothetical protein